MKASYLGSALLLSASIVMHASPVRASEWTEYFFFEPTGTTFYYDAASVRKEANSVYVSWLDTTGLVMWTTRRREWHIHDVRIDCAGRSMQNIRAHRLEILSRKSLGVLDLQHDRPLTIEPGSMAEHLHAKVC